TDAIRPLIETGVIDNSTKKRFRGVSVTTMAAGTLDFYRFLHGNSAIEFHRCSLTHNRDVISEIDGICAINSVLQADLLGNANAEQVNGKPMALPGGLPDFAAGASRARGGRSIAGAEHLQELQNVAAGVLDVVAEALAHHPDVARAEVGGRRLRTGIEDRHPTLPAQIILPFVGRPGNSIVPDVG